MEWKGLSTTTLADAGVTKEDGLIRVPYRHPDGREHNAKLFAPDGASWWERAGVELIPFGLETLPALREARDYVVFITEGESDALALREAFPLASAIGLPGAGTWRSEWRRCVSPFPLIYVVGDGDEAGRAMNATVKRDIPWARPVWLPEDEDIRSLLQEGRRGQLEYALEVADRDAHLWAAFVLAHDVERCEALLRGEAISVDD